MDQNLKKLLKNPYRLEKSRALIKKALKMIIILQDATRDRAHYHYLDNLKNELIQYYKLINVDE